jgi:hypothetical protein
MSRVWLGCLAFLGGCYAEVGLGYTGHATLHGSFGLVAHFGDVASVRAGAGGAVGRYEPAAQATAAYAGPVVVGGHARLLGDRDQLVASADVFFPWGGRLARDEAPVLDEAADVTRAFVGVGYRHSWRGKGGSPADEGGAFVATLGPEVFRTHPTSSALADDTRIGAAVSVMFVLRGGVLWDLIECLDAKKDRCRGEQ